MMFADGGLRTTTNSNNKKRSNTHHETGHKKSPSISLGQRINNSGVQGGRNTNSSNVAEKLTKNLVSDELKEDLVNSFARFVRAIKTTCKKYDLTNEDTSSQAEVATTQSPAKLTSTLPRKLPKQFKLATIDWRRNTLIGSQHSVSGNNHKHQLQHQASTVSKWIPEQLERSLQRSLSVQQARFSRSPTAMPSTCRSRFRASPKTGSKLNSWIDPMNLKPISVIFIVLNIILMMLSTQPAFSAPLPPSESMIQPIWLRDGLMSIDQTSTPEFDMDSVVPVEAGTFSELVQAYIKQQQLKQLEQQLQNEQQPVVKSDSLEVSVPLVVGSSESQLIDPLEQEATQMNQQSEPDDQLLWIQRRRLNRDRALEPPYWLRDRPTRRWPPVTEVSLVDSEYDEEDDDSKPSTSQLLGRDYMQPSRSLKRNSNQNYLSPRMIRGRQSRQLSKDLYEEILKHLIDETLENQSLVDELYDELERRYNSQQRPGGSRPIDLNQLQAQQQQIQQQNGKLMQQDPPQVQQLDGLDKNSGNPETLAIDPDSTLIVAGDEVSGTNDEDVTPIDSPLSRLSNGQANNGMSAAYTRETPLSPQDYGRIISSGGNEAGNRRLNLENILSSSGHQQSTANDGAGYIFGGQRESSPMMNDQQQSYDSSGYDLNDPASQSRSFHVIEDIDQTDDSQVLPISSQAPSGIPQDDTNSAMISPVIERPERWIVDAESRSNKDKRAFVNEWMAANALAGRQVKRSKVKQQQKQSSPTNQVVEQLQPISGFNNYRFASGNRASPSASGPGNANDMDPSPIPATSGPNMESVIEASSRDQLIKAATKLKYHLEDMIGLPRSAILGLFPADNLGRSLLVKLDRNKLSNHDLWKLRQNYEYARGYIMLQWPTASPQNPLPLVRAILNALANKQQTAEDAMMDEQVDVRKAPQQQQQQSSRYNRMVAQLPLDGQPQLMQISPLIGQMELGENAADEQDDSQLTEIEPQVLPEVVRAPYDLADDEPRPVKQRLTPASYLASLIAQDPKLLAKWGQFGPMEEGQPEKEDEEQLPAASLNALKLAAYLNALSLADQQAELQNRMQYNNRLSGLLTRQQQLAAAAAADLGLRRRVGLLAASLRGWTEADQAEEEAESSKSTSLSHTHLIHMISFLLALACAYLAIKFVLRRYESKLIKKRLIGGRRKSDDGSGDESSPAANVAKSFKCLWASRTTSGSLVGATSKESEAGNPVGRSSSNDSGHGTVVDSLVCDDKRKNFDILTQKLAGLLKFNQTTTVDQKETTNQDDSDSIASSGVEPAPAEDNFRSSSSYIKSLIEALAKARPQVFNTSGGQGQNCAEDVEASCAMMSKSSTLGETQPQDTTGELITSQMDISAAHLILNYMEKHLDDKERLRREWMELNAGAMGKISGTSNKSSTNNGTKMNQLVLARLAKVALADENRNKNKNSLVVPFDRNRVRLGGCGVRAGSKGKSGPRVATPTSPNSSGISSNGNSSGSGAQIQPSDYINASYIYDDDPRRPTHIIAQGPSELTCGHFWQMIWEQDISVIVMLTRLNENSTKMCHCYWPTNVGSTPASASTATSSSASAATTATATTAADKRQTQSSEAEPDVNVSGSSKAQAKDKSCADSAISSISATPTTPGNCVATTPSSATNGGRRGSVTSVFNTITSASSFVGAGSGHVAQPIIANGDLGDNVLIFEVTTSVQATNGRQNSSSIDEQDDSVSQSRGQKNNNKKEANNNKSAPKSSSNQAAIVTVQFEVQLVSEHVSSNDYLVRNMYLINRTTGETRNITQFHYLAWLEQGVPENVKSFLQFRRKVHKSYRNLKKPILVHCSDGAGRSGTYCLIDIILERIRNGAKEIDPRATLEHLRDQRTGLCATLGQFEFVLVALAEEIQIILDALPR